MQKKSSKPKKSKATGAKRGGKPGNQNARTHGLWAKNQPKVTASGEANIETNKIERRRQILDAIIEALYSEFDGLPDIETRCKCANAISFAATAANGCDRTLAVVSGKLTDLTNAIEQLFADEKANDPSTVE